MIKKVRVHTCPETRDGRFAGDCTCRKYVTVEKAEQLKENGLASHIISSHKQIEVEGECGICGADQQLKKSCRVCNKTGIAFNKKDHFEYSEDLYMRPILRTPRTATIEKNHIEYAYIKLDKDAAKRIELYHQSDKLALAKLGAEIRDSRTQNILIDGTPEPEDNPKTGTGRRFDYGRPI